MIYVCVHLLFCVGIPVFVPAYTVHIWKIIGMKC